MYAVHRRAQRNLCSGLRFYCCFCAIWASTIWSIYLFFFFLVRFHLLWQRGQSEYECSRGGCAMYEIQQPKNVVRHATATVHFLFAMSAWEKISFFVRSTSICLSSLLMYCTFTIINNLLSSLQNKFPFFFFVLWIYVNGSTHWYAACQTGHVTNITLLQQFHSTLLSRFDSRVINFCIS